MSAISLIQPDRDLFSWPQYWAACFGPAPFLPMSREEMDQLGWDSCDIILVTGDAYVDHPSFGMAICGRMLEAQGFRVGIISQPDWNSKDDFMRLGKPNLFFGVTAGNMDSMINRYTADRKLRHDDAYTPDNVAGKRPDRATLVYTQRCKEAWKDVPVILGGIEASLRRTAHYDYWSDTVRRSVLVDSKADMLIYGNGERPLVEVAHRLSQGEPVSSIRDVRNTAIMVKEALPGWSGWIPASSICRAKSTRSRIRTAKICRVPITNRLSRKSGSEGDRRAAAASEAVGKDLRAAAVLREGESRQGALRARVPYSAP
jgi:uncharacterized radical SAM protein YgiQ